MNIEKEMTMNTAQIHKLASEVVDQIAAGEVVERPSHLVKELLENSWDAGATKINIEVSEGGRKIRVTDNGKGINSHELPLAFERFATSKIKRTEDLWNLSSFGFRGEALASIASVSRLTITSRTPLSPKAFQMTSEFGKLSETQESSGAVGTSISLEALFENVPVRLKFLKSEVSEFGAIRNVVKAMALSHFESEIRYLENGKLYYYWTPAESKKIRVEQVLECNPMYNSEAHRERADANIHCECVFASPRDTLKSGRNIWIFVQNRWVQDRGIQAAIMDSYRGLLMTGQFPQVVIWLNAEAQSVDVNIHPNKSQVRFQDGSLAYQVVQSALRKGLEMAPWVGNLSNIGNISKGPSSNESANLMRSEFLSHHSGHQNESVVAPCAKATKVVAKEVANEVDKETIQVELNKFTMPETDIVKTQSIEQANFSFSAPEFNQTLFKSKLVPESPEVIRDVNKSPGQYWSLLQVLSQTNLTYILAQSDSALILIDQHAAHERVLYEKLMSDWMQKGEYQGQDIQNYLIPLVLDVQPEKLSAVEEHLKSLEVLGIHAEILGKSSLCIKAAPLILKESALIMALHDMIEEIYEWGGSYSIEKSIAHVNATLACHSAIRAGQSLSVIEMKSLLSQMDDFPLSSFCPHGRPVSVEYPFREIEKSFGRVQ